MKGPNGFMIAFTLGLMIMVSYGPRLFEKGPGFDNPITQQKPAEQTGVPKPLQAAPLAAAEKTKAITALDRLAIKPEASMAGYSREKFPHWRITRGTCDGRDEALKRYGKNLTARGCDISKGTWYDPYTGKNMTLDPTHLDADHVVALAEAWRSGAQNWTTAQREEYANNDALVILVTDASVNRSKGDKDPKAWKPPLRAYWQRYAVRWIAIKQQYSMTIDQAEYDALKLMLQ